MNQGVEIRRVLSHLFNLIGDVIADAESDVSQRNPDPMDTLFRDNFCQLLSAIGHPVEKEHYFVTDGGHGLPNLVGPNETGALFVEAN